MILKIENRGLSLHNNTIWNLNMYAILNVSDVNVLDLTGVRLKKYGGRKGKLETYFS